MDLESKINQLHASLNYQLKPQPIKSLQQHHIKIAKVNRSRRIQLKVRAFHYCVLSATRSVPSTAMFISEANDWEEIGQNLFYYEKELQEFALLCLYLTNTPLGECIVQRFGKKDMCVIQLRELTVNQLSEKEQERLAIEINKLEKKGGITFGADLEVMLQNNKTKKFINGNVLTNQQFGFDQAIAINQNRVFHPIIEIRPKPSANIEQFHNHLLVLYKKFKAEATNYQLNIITKPNPFDRFYLGGHIHFGNIPFTFKHVRLLDQFVAIPFGLVERQPSYERRKSYGKIGSVRKNQFDGFEYRVLPSWFELIPSSLPMFIWIYYLMENVGNLPPTLLNKRSLRSYYDERADVYSLEQWEIDYKDSFHDEKGKVLFENYVSYLKKLSNTRESL